MRKLFFVMLSLVLFAAVVLSACGSKEAGAPKNDESDIEINPIGEAAVADKQISFTVFAAPSPQIEDLETNYVTTFIEEKLNIDLNFDVAPSAGAEDRKKLLLASGDYPDVFLSGNLTQAEQLEYGKQGVLIPLNDLIDKYGNEIKRAFKLKPDMEKAITAPDGNIYALPHINDCFHCWYSQKLWINQTWLDALKLKMPTTTDEYYQVLKAFKTQDPNGNGKPDEVPLSGAADSWHTIITEFLMNPFIYNNGSDYFFMKDGKVGLAAAQPEWRKGLEWIGMLYSEGLIDKESFTQTVDVLSQVGNREEDNILGSVTVGHIGMAFNIGEGQERHKSYVTVAPLVGPDGHQSAGYFESYGNGNFAITNKATEKQAIAAIRFADYLYSEEHAIMNEYGPEGKWWRPAKAGELDEHGNPAKRAINPEYWKIQTQNDTWSQMGITFRSREIRESWVAPQDPLSTDGYEHRLFTETAKSYEGKQPKEVFPPAIFMEPDAAKEAAQLRTQINDYVKSNMVQFITGSKNIAAEWDDYMKGFKGLKLDRYLEIYQKAYDEMYK